VEWLKVKALSSTSLPNKKKYLGKLNAGLRQKRLGVGRLWLLFVVKIRVPEGRFR
jgi:hypothetical protein